MDASLAQMNIRDGMNEPPASILPGAWAQAHAEFSRDLTPAEKLVYQSASINTIVEEVKSAKNTIESSKSKRFLDKISPFLQAVKNYESALDVLSNTYAPVMAPLWGGLRVILYLARNYESYFRELVELLSQIGECIPRFSSYEKLFSSHEPVVKAVTAIFLDILHFCNDVKRFLRQPKWKLGFKLILEQKSRIELFKKHNETIAKEIDLAHMIEAERSWKASRITQDAIHTMSTEDREWHLQRAQDSFVELFHRRDYERDKQLVSKSAPGTCEWLLQHNSFWKWWQGNTSLLSVSLGPAMGKSVLARAIVDFLGSNNPAPISETAYKKTVCYFFFKAEDDSRRDARFAVSALIHQLLCNNPILVPVAMKLVTSTSYTYSHYNLWNTFEKIVLAHNDKNQGALRVYWVIDGLDECEESSRMELAADMTQLLRIAKGRFQFKVVFTSRPLSSIFSIFEDSCSGFGIFERLGDDQVDQRKVQAEVRMFINDRIQYFKKLRRQLTRLDDDASEALRQWLCSRNNPNYLWVSFIFKELEKNAAMSKDDLKDVIETLPPSCSDFYERILTQSLNPQKSRMLLHAVVVAVRPLTIDEANYVLSLRTEHNSMNDINLIPENSLEKTLQELCGFFINVVDKRIHLIHQTAKEFLIRDSGNSPLLSSSMSWMHSLDTSISHAIMARACLQYLQVMRLPTLCTEEFLHRDRISDEHGFWWDDNAQAINAIDRYSKMYPFFQYAACHWHDHLEKCNSADEQALVDLALKFCDVKSQLWKTWFAVFVRNWTKFSSIPPFAKTLQFVSWFGFLKGVKVLTRQNDYSDDEKLLALAMASMRNHRNITRLLLELECPKESRAKRLRGIDAVLRQVENAFHDADPEIRKCVDGLVQGLSFFREHLVEEMELAADARYAVV